MFNFLANPISLGVINFFKNNRLFLISIEYKFFVYNSFLYILLGNSNYLLIPCVFDFFFIKCRKKKMFL